MDVSLIIVNYNTTEFIKVCLKSIIRFTEFEKNEIIVVDNNSNDRYIEKISKQFSKVKFYFRSINDGFGGGCNFGAEKASGKYLLFVNPDIEFEEDVPKIMSAFMVNHPDTGACSPVFVNYENELIYTYNKFPNIKWEFFEFLGRGNEKQNKLFLNDERIISRSKEPIYTDWTTGACLMVRADLFRKVRGFDRDYFLYYEDTDLQYRIHKLGFKIAVLSNIRVRHFVNSSVKSIKGDDIYHFHINRSKLLYFYKNFGFLKRNSLRLLIITGVLLRMLSLKFRKRYHDRKAQKMNQYLKILRLLLSDKESLIKTINKE